MFNFGGEKSILGIDLRVTSVKVIEILPQKEKQLLLNWGMGEVPIDLREVHPDKEKAQAELLKEIISKKKIKAKSAVVVVGGTDVFVKRISLSALTKSEIPEAIRWKIAEEIPFPIEEALFDYYELTREEGSTAEKYEFIVAAIHKNIYNQTLQVLQRAGLKLTSVTVVPEAMLTVFQSEIDADKEKVVSVVYMGRKTTNISIFKKGELQFNRELPLGGENITRAMTGVLVSSEGRVEINPDEAEKMKTEYGVPIDLESFPKIKNIPLNQLQAMVRPALEKVQDEIMRTFEYYKGQTGEEDINKIILTGGGSLTPHMVEFLKQGLGIEIVTTQLTQTLVVDDNLPDKEVFNKGIPQLTAAIGAALSFGGDINLLPPEHKFRGQLFIQKYFNPRKIAIGGVIFLALIYLGMWLATYSLEQQILKIKIKQQAYKPRLAQLETITRLSGEERKKQKMFASFEKVRSELPKIVKEIGSLTPKNAFIYEMDISAVGNGGQLELYGTVFEVGDSAENVLANYVLSLARSELFKDVTLISATSNGSYRVDAFDFHITARILE